MIEAFAFLVTLWQLQSFFSPQPFNLLVIDLPAFNTKKFSDFTIAIATIVFGQSDQSQPKAVIILIDGFIILG